MSIEVATQAELDKAIAAHPDKWVTITGTGWFHAAAGRVASGSASVRAYGSASVRAYGSASVRAYGSASVRASGSASVRAYGSASVEAYDSASVEAYDSASVRAYDSASVRASRMVSIHNYRPDATDGPKITGGVVIDVRPPADIHEWLADHHIEPDEAGVVVLFKAVNDAFVSSRDFAYTPGKTPVAPDWDGGKQECGGGLHFCGAPWIARARFNRTATRFVACPVKVSDIAYDPSHSMLEKVKAKGCCAPVWECDIDGNPVDTTGAVEYFDEDEGEWLSFDDDELKDGA